MRKILLAMWLAFHLAACASAVTLTPTPAPPLTAQPVSAKTSPLTVASSMLTVDEFGDFHCTGELLNNTAAPVEITALTATITNRLGVTVSVESAWAVARQLAPQARTPFRVSPLGLRHAVVSDYECVLALGTKVAVAPAVTGLQLKQVSYRIDAEGFTHITGQITNTGDTEISTTLIGGLKDTSGRVIDADWVKVRVPPQATVDFDLAMLAATSYHKALQRTVASAVVITER